MSSKIATTRLAQAEINTMFERLYRENPTPQGELHWVNEFTLLVAVVLSAQTTDVGVNKCTTGLFANVTTPQQMLELGEDRLRETIRTIGLYRVKAKNVIALSRQLIDNHDGEVPRSLGELIKLPGVGRKTANVVLNIAFGQPTIAVDTHIFRTSNRTGLAHGASPLEVERQLLKKVPTQFSQHAHHWLILHGRYICKARKPECAKCLINDLCLFDGKTV